MTRRRRRRASESVGRDAIVDGQSRRLTRLRTSSSLPTVAQLPTSLTCSISHMLLPAMSSSILPPIVRVGVIGCGTLGLTRACSRAGEFDSSSR
jgi:hypothetical protein